MKVASCAHAKVPSLFICLSANLENEPFCHLIWERKNGQTKEKQFCCCCLEIVYSVEHKITIANKGLSLCKWGEILTFFRIFSFLQQCEIQIL